MASNPVNIPNLCLTICAYRNPAMTEQEYRDYMVNKHAPLAEPLLRKYGILKYNMTHNSVETRKLTEKIADPQLANAVNYDCIVQIVFRDIQDFVRMKEDPEYQERVAPDHENFADMVRSRMMIGYIRGFIDTET